MPFVALMKVPGKAFLSAYAILALFNSAAGQTQSASNEWKGKYEYEASLGRTVPGTGVVIGYTIEISASNARLGATIHAEGYQTDETLRCDTKTQGSRIDLLFNSYPDGGTANQYGVELYKKGDLLLSLERVTSGKRVRYLVNWGKYVTEVKKRVFFKKTG